MIEVHDLCAGYGGLDILRGVELAVEENSICCIVGPNGAGKSTLLKTISGLLTAHHGSIHVAGSDITRCTPVAILRAGVVQVPQRHGLFTSLTVKQNVLMGGYLIRRQRRTLEHRYRELAALFPPLSERPHALAGALSGGQRRIVEFARALMPRPRVVLLDEPTLGLDPNSVRSVRSSIETMQRSETTILMVEQNVRFGLALADQAVVMSAGRVALTGSGHELAERPHLLEVFFGGSGPARAAARIPR